ncbi:hypothetical protein [Sulfurovum mangrovi]|nr:hypothetical protein [Sulfurovum mangrovi]UFH59195.1 hypothetical protein LN246_12760 [Sulfurovum mangrovi]
MRDYAPYAKDHHHFTSPVSVGRDTLIPTFTPYGKIAIDVGMRSVKKT